MSILKNCPHSIGVFRIITVSYSLFCQRKSLKNLTAVFKLFERERERKRERERERERCKL